MEHHTQDKREKRKGNNIMIYFEKEKIFMEAIEPMTIVIAGQHGIYVPYIFATRPGFEDLNNQWQEQKEILKKGVDNKYYWKAWQEVLDRPYFYLRKVKYVLHQTNGADLITFQVDKALDYLAKHSIPEYEFWEWLDQ